MKANRTMQNHIPGQIKVCAQYRYQGITISSTGRCASSAAFEFCAARKSHRVFKFSVSAG